jgi:hypothetical protein
VGAYAFAAEELVAELTTCVPSRRLSRRPAPPTRRGFLSKLRAHYHADCRTLDHHGTLNHPLAARFDDATGERHEEGKRGKYKCCTNAYHGGFSVLR